MNRGLAARYNRQRVLELFRVHKQLSRRRLCDLTGLGKATVSGIAADLLSAGVLRDVGELPSTSRGQRRIALELNPGLGCVLGVEWRFGALGFCLLDGASGMVVTEYETAPETMLEALPERVVAWLARQEMERPLLAAGLALPGIVDPRTGVLEYLRVPGVRHLEIGRALEDSLGVPVGVDNECRLAARAEAEQGSAAGEDDFVLLLLVLDARSDGNRVLLATSLFLGGSPYSGPNCAAGEITRVLHFETTVSDEDLGRLSEADATLPPNLIEDMERLAARIAAIACLLDVGMFVVGGDRPLRNRQALELLRDRAGAGVLPVPGTEVRIVPATFARFGPARGAAALALDLAMERVVDGVTGGEKRG